MYSNKRTPRVNAHMGGCIFCMIDRLHCNMLCSSNKCHSNRLCMTFPLMQEKYYEGIYKVWNQVQYWVGSEWSVLSLCEIISRITCRKAINWLELVAGPTSKNQDTPCICNLVGKKLVAISQILTKSEPQCLHAFLAQSIGNYLCTATCDAAQTSVVLLCLVEPFH